MSAPKPVLRFGGAVVGLAVVALLTACGDYRGDASALQRNEPLTAALRRHEGDTAYTLPKEIQSLNCYFTRPGMLCDVVLDIRDPDVAKQLNNPDQRLIEIDDKRWYRRDGTPQIIYYKREYVALSDAKFNFVLEREARSGRWVVRANVDASRVPFEEAASLMLLAVVDTASDYTQTLKELYATSPRANLQSWSDGASGKAGTTARSMADDAVGAAAELSAAASAAAASLASTSPPAPNAASASLKPGGTK
ncbi:hypothetical protein [Burkholderia ambifaria]|uniref:hypothetical protein n=1 Tax=Burkholderia ambifaria TaxID=152480 RepID=UPI000B74F06D|nr:hypothetical protein [Burkholderia ambifaria]OUE46084.1 hypothetical protein BZY94_09745 [Burkholderia territorii]HDR9497271.1 hypothetical protein [Burkholderia cepacia]